MLRGLWQLTWIEIKIFLREPLGASAARHPVVVFLHHEPPLGGPRAGARRPGVRASCRHRSADFRRAAIVASAVLSLVAIIAIYREGGILKRLRATPLRPLTILTAHVS